MPVKLLKFDGFSSLTRLPVQENIAGFSPSDSGHTREYIIVADNRKSMSHHEKSFTQKVGSIKRMKKLPPKVLEEIYFKSKLPAVTYGTVVWENCR